MLQFQKCTEFKLESSSITGEAEPIDYQAESVAHDVTVFESRNVAFNGSLCVDGFGVAIVVRIGVNTVGLLGTLMVIEILRSSDKLRV